MHARLYVISCSPTSAPASEQALSNISRFMEARQTSPQLCTVFASIRVLTRVFPALLADPGLRSWCWERRP